MTTELIVHAQQLLAQVLGKDAQFRPGQWEAIQAAMQPGQRLIVVQRTGWGKSLVYFMATRLNRDAKRGMTILISPLLSLMRNQIDAARCFGLCAERIDNTNSADHADIVARLLRDEVDLLLISPERLGNQQFREQVWPSLKKRIGLMVIDEVHCISDWGHDFRPDYRRVMHILDELPPGTPVLGTTATANNRVINDICEILGGEVRVSRGSLTRSSLQLYVFPEVQPAAYRLVLLSHLLASIKGSGIIYCTTTRDCLIVSNWLKQEGFNVEPYFSDVEAEIKINRVELEQKLIRNEVKALVASVALGMGFDKPDLGFVIHYQMPGSIIGYYQQIGRAGRGIDNAHIVLMRGEEDREIQEFFIESAFPKPVEVRQVMSTLRHGPTTRSELLHTVNVSKSVLDKILLHLEIEGLAHDENGVITLMGDGLPDFERWNRVQAQRYDELAQMEAYATTHDCLMRFLARALEDPTNPPPCGRCKNCRGLQSRFVITPERLLAATDYLLRGNPIWIEPRKQWPRRDMVTKGAILKTTNERGLALSYYNDAGYGKLVRSGKYVDGRFSDELVIASADLIAAHWKDSLDWVTNVPSTRHPNLVADFAKRLAQRLNLPYRAVITCVREYPEQKTMQNTHQQLNNIIGAFSVGDGWLPGSVLLVDDIIDSGWTLTLLGWHLRELGVARVYPFVLARATSGQY